MLLSNLIQVLNFPSPNNHAMNIANLVIHCSAVPLAASLQKLLGDIIQPIQSFIVQS